MRIRYYYFAVLLVFLTSTLSCSGGNPVFKEINSIPNWVKESSKNEDKFNKYDDQGGLIEVNNQSNKTQIIIQRKNGKYLLNFYQQKKFVKTLLTSNIGFGNAVWSKNNQYFSIVNITSVHDITHDGDLYVYQLSNGHNLELLYSEKEMGGNAVGFSNSCKYFSYGSNRDLVVYDIKNKKKKTLKIPSEQEGSISAVYWASDDSELFLFYVTSVGTKLYLVSDFI